MDAALPILVTAGELTTVAPVANIFIYLGWTLLVVGWGFLVFQNYRYSPVMGALSIIPLWAVIYGIIVMEHRKKPQFLAVFFSGIVVVWFGSMLLFANDICEEDPKCGAPPPEEEETAEETESESSAIDELLTIDVFADQA
jgi:hypothetical protein